MTQEIKLRPEVQAFAELMEMKLRKNDHKPGWLNDHPKALFNRIYDEMKELSEAIDNFPLGGEGKFGAQDQTMKVANEAADVANFAMMIADRVQALRRV